jgi:hypothetical protein
VAVIYYAENKKEITINGKSTSVQTRSSQNVWRGLDG